MFPKESDIQLSKFVPPEQQPQPPQQQQLNANPRKLSNEKEFSFKVLPSFSFNQQVESSQDHLDNKNLIEKMKERFKNQTNGSEDSDTNIIKEKIKKLTQP